MTEKAEEPTADGASATAGGPGTSDGPAAEAATPEAATARRDELLREHAEQRRRRDQAALGSDAYRAAAMRVSEIEVEIARIERAAGVG